MSFASSSNRFVGRNFPFIFSRLLCSKSCPLGLRLFAFALYIYYLKWTVTVAVNVTDGCDPSRPICLVWRTCHWTQRNSDLHSPPPFCGVLSTFEGAALACIWWLLKLWIAPFVWLCVVDKAFAVSCCTNNIPLTTYSISYFYLCIDFNEHSRIKNSRRQKPTSKVNVQRLQHQGQRHWSSGDGSIKEHFLCFYSPCFFAFEFLVLRASHAPAEPCSLAARNTTASLMHRK